MTTETPETPATTATTAIIRPAGTPADDTATWLAHERSVMGPKVTAARARARAMSVGATHRATVAQNARQARGTARPTAGARSPLAVTFFTTVAGGKVTFSVA